MGEPARRSRSSVPRVPALETIDGGRSHVVRHTLERLVRDTRETLEAEIALVLYRGPSGEPHARVLACDSAAPESAPMTNEPFWLGDWSASSKPASWRDAVVLRSALRRFELELVSGLIIPWSHTSGRGWLVAGRLPGSSRNGSLDISTAHRYAAKLRQAHTLAGLRGATRLQREIALAAEQLAEAAVAASDVTSLLESIALGARTLLGTSAAYVALPAPDGGFTMTVHLNVRTASFRQLRLSENQGLGGLTHRERRTIISPNYPEDRRLVDPPIVESLREGFRSAICVPLIADDEVIGLLYTANRHLTPFSETDGTLLEQFARFASLGLRRAEAERHRQAVVRRLDQERLAFQLHDSIVRTLIEIGYEADTGLRVNDDPSLRNHLERIGHATEACLQAIREQIATMANPGNSPGAVDLGDVLAAIDSSRPPKAVPRTLHVRGASSSHPLPARAASALISIGQEALQNADLHSLASHVDIRIEVADDRATLVVSDDGQGIGSSRLPILLDEASGHLGLQRMRRAAGDVGGGLALGTSEAGGVRVEATIPLG